MKKKQKLKLAKGGKYVATGAIIGTAAGAATGGALLAPLGGIMGMHAGMLFAEKKKKKRR